MVGYSGVLGEREERRSRSVSQVVGCSSVRARASRAFCRSCECAR